LWSDNPDDIEEWLDKVMNRKEKVEDEEYIYLSPDVEIEG